VGNIAAAIGDPVTTSGGLQSLAGALADVVRWLTDEKIPGVVIGGVAASLLGRPRLTRDIDALVLGDEMGWEAVLESARPFGIAPRVDDPLDFAHRTRILLLRHLPSSVDIDVSLGALPFEREVVERASIVSAGDIRVRVPAVEDLVIMKALARRPRDLGDIEGLLDVWPDIDLDRIRQWLREFGSILEMPEIQEDFERLLRQRRKA
jgi:predicted nucleotidyltransferase